MKASVYYRPDIDGLRAVAVISVVLFHAKFAIFPGGYTGVDIFFVISGFLITSIISGNLRTKRFSFASFYAARARRIMPALVFMLSVVTALSYWILLPDELDSFGKNLIESLLFTVNVFLWRDTGYFELAANLRPLLHLWSLAVEEQFYLLWPLLLWFLSRFSKPYLATAASVAVLVISLAVSQWGAIHEPNGAFYLAPSRAWELMAGAVVAVTGYHIRRALWQQIAGAAGLGLIGCAIFLFDRHTTFPGLNAVVPCLGAVLLVCAGPQTLASRLLAISPMVATGRISYSLYLWHWPLLVLGALALGRPLSPAEAGLIIALSFGLAALSWVLVEQPFRKQFDPERNAPSIFLWVAIAALPLMLVGIFFIRSEGMPGRFPAPAMQTFQRSQAHTANWQRCHVDVGSTLPPAAGCIFGAPDSNSEYQAVLWGDSHAAVLLPLAETLARQNGFGVRQMTESSCPPVLNLRPGIEKTPEQEAGCTNFNRAAIRAIIQKKGVKLVIISARWHSYTFSDPTTPSAASDALLSRDMTAMLQMFAKKNIRTLVVGEVPESVTDPSRCFLRSSLIKVHLPWCSRFQPQQQDRLDAIDKTIQKTTAGEKGVTSIFPKQILCTRGGCSAIAHGDLLYRDDNHLSIAGAMSLLPLLKGQRF